MTACSPSVAVQSELEEIRRTGPLTPERTVDFARSPNTALHRRFNWDDAAAAHQHRLSQARQIIRTYVCIVPSENKAHRTYVSVTNQGEEREYVTTVSVLADDTKRRQLVLEQLDRIQAILAAHPLEELDGVVKACQKARLAV